MGWIWLRFFSEEVKNPTSPKNGEKWGTIASLIYV
jgi:hypothetical protein